MGQFTHINNLSLVLYRNNFVANAIGRDQSNSERFLGCSSRSIKECDISSSAAGDETRQHQKGSFIIVKFVNMSFNVNI